uniref:Uncharacterized protein n=1 Tax=Panstrongylus lignarius TaxID=156445 RepID=A0A224Y3A9_9HEMI
MRMSGWIVWWSVWIIIMMMINTTTITAAGRWRRWWFTMWYIIRMVFATRTVVTWMAISWMTITCPRAKFQKREKTASWCFAIFLVIIKITISVEV